VCTTACIALGSLVRVAIRFDVATLTTVIARCLLFPCIRGTCWAFALVIGVMVAAVLRVVMVLVRAVLVWTLFWGLREHAQVHCIVVGVIAAVVSHIVPQGAL
jgi:hypothetical protein